MPRIESHNGPENRETVDLCLDCYTFAIDCGEYPEDEYQRDALHPPYEETEYHCEDCGEALSEDDNTFIGTEI